MIVFMFCLGFLLAVANGMGREKAFCTSRLLSEAHANPTAFCTAQGILIHYCTGALALWFLVYTINLVQVHLSVFHSVLSTSSFRGTRTHPNFVPISVYRQEILRFVV